MAPLAHVPVPCPDETLSSLLLRLARNHGASAHEFCATVWPGMQFWTRDIDRTAPEFLLAAVARETGIEVATLLDGTLRGVVRALGFGEQVHGLQRGILPVGVFHRVRRRFGQQYCPLCLAEEPAHLRRLWRVGFLVACPRHGVLLRDACPHCGAPFIPHRAHAMARRACHRCGGSLVAGKTGSAPPRAVLLQQLSIRALSERLGDAAAELGHGASLISCWMLPIGVSGVAFLDGVERFCRLAAGASGGVVVSRSGRRRTWCLLRVAERAAVMDRVGGWLSGWPGSFLEWANAARLSRHWLDAALGPWPAWTSGALERLPFAFGPLHSRKGRSRRLYELRRRYKSAALWREARAMLLLRRAGVLKGHGQ